MFEWETYIYISLSLAVDACKYECFTSNKYVLPFICSDSFSNGFRFNNNFSVLFILFVIIMSTNWKHNCLNECIILCEVDAPIINHICACSCVAQPVHIRTIKSNLLAPAYRLGWYSAKYFLSFLFLLLLLLCFLTIFTGGTIITNTSGEVNAAFVKV